VFLEAKRVTGVFAFEGRQKVITMMATRAAMKDGLIAEESGLPEDIEITHDAHFAHIEIGFQVGQLDGFAFWTATGIRPRPRNFNAVSIGQAMIPGDADAFGQIDIDGEVGHGRPWQEEGETDSVPIPQLRLL